MDMSYARPPLWYYQDSEGDEWLSLRLLQKVDLQQMVVCGTPNWVCAQSCATGLLFSGHVRQSSLLQGAEQAQVSDLFIS